MAQPTSPKPKRPRPTPENLNPWDNDAYRITGSGPNATDDEREFRIVVDKSRMDVEMNEDGEGQNDGSFELVVRMKPKQ